MTREITIHHCGGVPFVTEPLAAAQRQFGAAVTVSSVEGWGARGEAEALNLSSFDENPPDVVHFHRGRSLLSLGDDPSKVLKRLAEIRKKSVVIFSDYDLGRASELERKLSEAIEINEILRIDFLPGRSLDPTSALPFPLHSPKRPKAIEPPSKPEEIRMVYLLEVDPVFERDTSSKVLEKANKFGSACSILSPIDIRSEEELERILSGIHLLIEYGTHGGPSALAAYALARGIPVLAPATPRVWQPTYLSYSPETFVSRVESILREPKCLRDLSARAKTHAETTFFAPLVAKTLLDHIEDRLLESSPTLAKEE